MNIHEHQAKKILQGFGASIAPGVAITDINQAKAAIASLHGPIWVAWQREI